VFFPSIKRSRGELTLDFHDLALAVIVGIAALVAPAFVYRLNAPIRSITLEHEVLETAWTVGPIVVLVGLAIPRLQLLYTIDESAGVSALAVCEGHQWYWNYKVGIREAWDSYMSTVTPRLLASSSAPTLPISRNSLNITRTDVLHRFALPALACKADAVPGRINRQYIHPTAPGMYLGQCSELCGANHSFIPTAVEVR